MTLAGKRVVVTRRHEQAGSLTALLSERGAAIIELPTIDILPPESWTLVDDSIRRLAAGDFEWVVFTSANAVEKLCSRLGCMPGEVFTGTKVAAVGTSTRAVLAERGVEVDLVPERFTATSLAGALGPGSGELLLPRAEDVPPDMVEMLRGAGWSPHEVAVYRTVPAEPDPEVAETIRSGGFDVVTFTSASTVNGFHGIFPDPAAVGLGPANGHETDPKVVACIGPVTAQACREAGIRVDLVAEPHTAAGLVAALDAAGMGT